VLKPTLHGLTKNASPGLSILYRWDSAQCAAHHSSVSPRPKIQ
jgi:hypothetical protein